MEREANTHLIPGEKQSFCVCPTTNDGMQNGSSVENMYTLHARFLHVLASTRNAQSVIIDKNFCVGAQSEVCQECVVGWVGAQSEVCQECVVVGWVGAQSEVCQECVVVGWVGAQSGSLSRVCCCWLGLCACVCTVLPWFFWTRLMWELR